MDPRRLLDQPPLTAETERDLARRAPTDRLARDALVTAGLRHVVQRALALGVRGPDLDDAVQAGAVGLLEAVDRFDPDRGVRLATYAWSWIEGAIKGELRTTHEPTTAVCEEPIGPLDPWLDGLGADQAEVVTLRFGLDPHTRRETAAQLGVTESRVRTIEAEAMRHLRRSLARISPRASGPAEADPP